MKTNTLYLFFIAILMLSSEVLLAQSGTSGSSLMSWALWAVAIILFFVILIAVGDNLIGIEAQKSGVDMKEGESSSGFKLFSPKVPDFAEGKSVKFLKKGHDIKLQGVAEKQLLNVSATRYAVQPKNYVGMSPIPKVVVEVGDEVKAGDVLFFDKKRPDVKYVAPVSGEIVAINRAEKRSIKEVVILADREIQYKTFQPADINGNREDLVNFLLESGVWSMIRQRPYDIVPDPAETPKNIFISTFDSAPLAPDLDFVVEGQGAAFQKGLDVLGKLTDGSVHLGLNGKKAPSSVFTNATAVKQTYFHGKHPAGNVGIQIHHTAPISGSDKVWVLGVQDVITIGKLFTEGKFDASRIVAITGGEVGETGYVKTHIGANIGDLIKGNVAEGARLVSGDVLSGKAKTGEEFLNISDDQITTIKEGNEYEMFGWLLPTSARPSTSQTFLSGLLDITYEANTNTHGEKRAFVVTGQYEQVLPMDIYPQHLMKAILANDIERMEGLGITELSEEDIALCEFACTSKQPLQKILREGLEYMREQS